MGPGASKGTELRRPTNKANKQVGEFDSNLSSRRLHIASSTCRVRIVSLKVTIESELLPCLCRQRSMPESNDYLQEEADIGDEETDQPGTSRSGPRAHLTR